MIIYRYFFPFLDSKDSHNTVSMDSKHIFHRRSIWISHSEKYFRRNRLSTEHRGSFSLWSTVICTRAEKCRRWIWYGLSKIAFHAYVFQMKTHRQSMILINSKNSFHLKADGFRWNRQTLEINLIRLQLPSNLFTIIIGHIQMLTQREFFCALVASSLLT